MQAPGIERGEGGAGNAVGASSRLAEAPSRPVQGRPGDAGGTKDGGFRALLRTRRPARDGAGAKARGRPDAPAEAGRLLDGPLAGPAREISVRALAPRPEIARLLIGQAHEVRIELGGGVLEGTSIHLVAAPGGVEVRLGASTEAARLALASVMDRVGHRLRSRGIVIKPGAALDTGSRQSQRDGRAPR